MKRIVFLFVMLFLVFCLSGCGFSRYSSHYYTIAHGTSYDSDSVSVFFGEIITQANEMGIRQARQDA